MRNVLFIRLRLFFFECFLMIGLVVYINYKFFEEVFFLLEKIKCVKVYVIKLVFIFFYKILYNLIVIYIDNFF